MGNGKTRYQGTYIEDPIDVDLITGAVDYTAPAFFSELYPKRSEHI
jgi:hypothetical protein